MFEAKLINREHNAIAEGEEGVYNQMFHQKRMPKGVLTGAMSGLEPGTESSGLWRTGDRQLQEKERECV